VRRAALLYNPAAGGHRAGRLAPRLQELFAREGVTLAPRATNGPGEATALAREAAAGDDLDALFVLGGDGTVREAAAGLLGSALPLGVLPGGTTNVVAGALALPRSPLAAARRLLARSAPCEVDVGLAGDAPFLMQVSGGLDARALAAVSPRAKRRWGRLAVVAAGLRVWARYAFPELTFEADGVAGSATGVAVCNLSAYAGRYRLVPGGSWTDRRLDLFLFHGRSRRAALGFALALVGGRHAGRADVAFRTVETVTLTGPAPLTLQLDGDPVSLAPPLAIRLAPARLVLLAPRG